MFSKKILVVSLSLSLLVPFVYAGEVNDGLSLEKVSSNLNGLWGNRGQVECLSGQEPNLKPDIAIGMEAVFDGTTGRSIVLANKRVNSVACKQGFDSRTGKLLSVNYSFELLSLKQSQNMNVSNMNVSKENRHLIYEFLSEEDSLGQPYYFFKGLSIGEYDIDYRSALSCSIQTAISTFIMFPGYFERELSRGYIIKYESSNRVAEELSLYFKDELFCEEGFTRIPFSRL